MGEMEIYWHREDSQKEIYERISGAM